MQRRDFLALSGLATSGLLVPSFFGRAIAAEELLTVLDPAIKKRLADDALSAARDAGATYCDVRIGRYLSQAVMTREDKVQNVMNSESTGAGIRVIVNGAWGFAATSDLSPKGVVAAAKQAAAIARANSKYQSTPVQLAKAPAFGEVSWKTPIRKNAMAVPIKEKVELLLGVNAAALEAGASFVNSTLFVVNEQKYFASTDGSWIDQDVHRIWAPMSVTAIDKSTGKFRSRDGLSAPMGLGWEYLDGNSADKTELPVGSTVYGMSYDTTENAANPAKVEVQVNVAGGIVRAEERALDTYAAVDLVVAKIERQLKRFKGRLLAQRGETIAPPVEEPAEYQPPRVARVKRHVLRPMAPEDAAIQMEALGHEFFLFRNVETDLVSVIYLRDDGDYGLIEPAG